MTAAKKDQSEQVQQSMDTEDQSTRVNLFTEETYNSLAKADSEEIINQLN